MNPPTRNRLWRACKCVCWLADLTLQAYSACLSDCALDVQTRGGALLHYDFSPLANVTGFLSSPRFTNKGLKYLQSFNVALCGKEVRKPQSIFMFLCEITFSHRLWPVVFLLQGRMPATCVDNATGSGKEVKGYVCQSTVVPSELRSQSVVSSQPVLIGDSLVGTDRMPHLYNAMIYLYDLSNNRFSRLLKSVMKMSKR